MSDGLKGDCIVSGSEVGRCDSVLTLAVEGGEKARVAR